MPNGNSTGTSSITSVQYWTNKDIIFVEASSRNAKNSSTKFFLHHVLQGVMNLLQQRRPFTEILTLTFETDAVLAAKTQEALDAKTIYYSAEELDLFRQLANELRKGREGLSTGLWLTVDFLIAIAEAPSKKQCISSTVIALKQRRCYQK